MFSYLFPGRRQLEANRGGRPALSPQPTGSQTRTAPKSSTPQASTQQTASPSSLSPSAASQSSSFSLPLLPPPSSSTSTPSSTSSSTTTAAPPKTEAPTPMDQDTTSSSAASASAQPINTQAQAQTQQAATSQGIGHLAVSNSGQTQVSTGQGGSMTQAGGSQASGASSGPRFSEAVIHQLVQKGFNRHDVLAALTEMNGDPQKALMALFAKSLKFP